MAPDHLRVRLMQTEQLLRRWHLLALQHASGSLVDRLIDQGKEVVELLADALCLLTALLLQRLSHLCCLPPTSLSDVEQLGVVLLELLGGFFSFAAGNP